MKHRTTRMERPDDSEWIIYTWYDSPDAGKTAVFLPGYSYGTEAPAFFFLKLFLIASGYMVISAEYRYNENEKFQGLSDHAQEDYVRSDMEQFSEFLTAEDISDSLLIVGKSIGTIAQSFLNGELSHKSVRNIWLTPVLSVPAVLDGIMKRKSRSLVVIGDRDHFLDREKHRDLVESDFCNLMPDTDHGFLTSKPEENVDNHRKLMAILERWIGIPE